MSFFCVDVAKAPSMLYSSSYSVDLMKPFKQNRGLGYHYIYLPPEGHFSAGGQAEDRCTVAS